MMWRSLSSFDRSQPSRLVRSSVSQRATARAAAAVGMMGEAAEVGDVASDAVVPEGHVLGVAGKPEAVAAKLAEDVAVGGSEDAIAIASGIAIEAEAEGLVALRGRRCGVDEDVGALGLGRDEIHVAPAVEFEQAEVGLAPMTTVLGLGVAKPSGFQSSADDRREVPATAQAVVVKDGVLEVDVVLPGAVTADGDAAQARRIDAEGNVGRVVGQREVDEEVLA